jgi:endonuclease/exonuclease/phosphatase family metal-dependent hydrolase
MLEFERLDQASAPRADAHREAMTMASIRARALRVFACSAILAVAASVAAPDAACAAPADARIDVLTFNVLAPVWAAPVWYPADMDPSFLDTEYRRERIVAFLHEHADTADVVALQEVQDSEFAYLARALGEAFVGVMSTNDPDFWSNWLVDGIPWGPNGTAVFVRRSAFGRPRFHELDQSTGNSVAWVSARQLATGRTVRFASVHLDSDRQVNRQVELAALLDTWGSAGAPDTDIIAGDFNEDTVNGSLSTPLQHAGFVDVLAALGNREQTHPWIESYYMSNKWGIIDHVVVRGGEPLSGDVIDSGVWSIDDETARIEANFDAVGSDHFPVVAAVEPG